LPDLGAYRHFARLLYLKAALAIIDNRPYEAILVFKTTLAMARHLGDGPTLSPPVTGIAVASLICRSIPFYAELIKAPNLHEALAALPSPLIDCEKQWQAEIDSLKDRPQVNASNHYEQLQQIKAGHERSRHMVKRLERDFAFAQCLEAIRLYAVEHSGALPQTLADINVSIPDDVLNGRPFVYQQQGNQAVLNSPAPAGENSRLALKYDITVTGGRFAVEVAGLYKP
jgi:hypothetical protein